MFPCWHCKTQSQILRNKNRVSYQDQNENTRKPFRELGSLCKDNLYRVIVIIAHLNTNYIGNKFDFLTECLGGNVDAIMISETKTDEI